MTIYLHPMTKLYGNVIKLNIDGKLLIVGKSGLLFKHIIKTNYINHLIRLSCSYMFVSYCRRCVLFFVYKLVVTTCLLKTKPYTFKTK